MKTRNTIFFIILSITISVEFVLAQQLPLFSQYRENQSILNPAALNIDYIRNDYNFTAGISYRNQWNQTSLTLDNGYKEKFGPVTYTARLERIYPDNRFFIGGHLIRDEAGGITLDGLYIRAGYFIVDPNYAPFSLVGAISGGINLFELDLVKEGRGNQPIYNYNTQYTDIEGDNDFKELYPDIALGLFFWKDINSGILEGDIFYLGISMPQIFGLPLDDPKATEDPSIKSLLRTNFVGGIYKYLSEESFLEFSTNFTKLINRKGTPYVITPNARWHYKDWLWLGAGMKVPVAEKKDSNGIPFEELVFSRDNSDYGVSTILIDVGFNIGKNISYGWENRNLKLGIGYEFQVGDRVLKGLGETLEINLTYTFDTGGGRR